MLINRAECGGGVALEVHAQRRDSPKGQEILRQRDEARRFLAAAMERLQRTQENPNVQ